MNRPFLKSAAFILGLSVCGLVWATPTKLKVNPIAGRHFTKGRNQYQAKEWNAAIKSFKRILTKYPDATVIKEAIPLLADSYLRVDSLEKAETIIQIFRTNRSNREVRSIEGEVKLLFIVTVQFVQGTA